MRRAAQGHLRRSNPLIFPVRDAVWLLPGAVMFCLCYLLPYGMSFGSSFLGNSFASSFVGLENYRVLFGDRLYWLSAKNTLLFLALAIGVTLMLSIALAHWLFSARALQAFVLVLLLPVFLPASSISALWCALLGNRSPLLQWLPLKGEQWKFLSLLLLFIWKNAGAATSLLLVGLRQIDPSVLSAAQIDGASRRILLRKMELPLLRAMLAFALVYLTMNGVRIFRESYLLYGGYPPQNLYFVQHYINSYFMRLDYGLLSSAAVVFSNIVLALFLLSWHLLRKGEEESL